MFGVTYVSKKRNVLHAKDKFLEKKIKSSWNLIRYVIFIIYCFSKDDYWETIKCFPWGAWCHFFKQGIWEEVSSPRKLVLCLQGIHEYIHSLWNLATLVLVKHMENKMIDWKHVKNLTTPFKLKLFLP